MLLKTNKIIILFFSFYLIMSLSCQKEESSLPEKKDDKHEHESNESEYITLYPEQMKAIHLRLGSIELKELTATLKANGQLRVPNHHRGQVTSLYGGVVQSLHVQIGDYVQKGQIIAMLANPQFVQLQEEYLSVSNKIILAEQEMQRQKELQQAQAGALRNLQNANTELNILQVRKVSLEQQIQLMGINPNQLTTQNLKSVLAVVSPLSGVISEISASIGSYMTANQPIVEIVDNSSLHLDLQVFEKDLPVLKVGQIIHFTITNNPTQEYDAQVFSIGSTFANESKTISVHCQVSGNKVGLIDGMNITGMVSLTQATMPAVPNEAIVHAQGKDYIFIVTKTEAKTETHEHEHSEEKGSLTFKRIEVFKGVSYVGYTAITCVQDIPQNTSIVTQGAFFIQAKSANTGEHHH